MNGFLPPLTLAVALLSNAAVMAESGERAELVGAIEPLHRQMRASSVDVVISGEFRDETARSGHAFRTIVRPAGEIAVHRTAEANSEAGDSGESVLIFDRSEAVVLRSGDLGGEAAVSRVRPDGFGRYAELRAAIRNERFAADACWALHGFEIAHILANPDVDILGIDRFESQGVGIVRVRFDSAATHYPFDRGELHFRPDLMWSLTRATLDFPSTGVRSGPRIETWIVRPALWPDGSVFPVEVERSVEFLNRHDRIRSHTAFHARSREASPKSLFEIHRWMTALASKASRPGPAIEMENATPAPTGAIPVRFEFEPTRSPRGERIMKIASPASGAFAVFLAAAFYDRKNRRKRLRSTFPAIRTGSNQSR